MVEVVTAHKPIVDEEHLLAPAFFGELRLPDEAFYLGHIGLFLHGYEPLVGLRTEHADQALAQIAGGEVVPFRIVVLDDKLDIRVGDGDALELVL